MKIVDVYMVLLAVVSYLHQGVLSNLIFACVAVYFLAKFVKSGVSNDA